MDTTKTYQVDKHKQLVPLNGSTVNFSCFFEVKSKDNIPFNIAIVEQGEIKPKQYKLADNGYINGQLESDGQLKSYFLVLKAQQPCECSVRVALKPKESNGASQPIHPPNPSASTVPSTVPPTPNQHPYVEPNLVVVKSEPFFQLKYIVGISVTLIAVYFIYRYNKRSGRRSIMPSMSTTSF